MRTVGLRLLFGVSMCAGALPTASYAQATIPDSEAAAHVGEVAIVAGVVANVFTSRAGNTFLNFGQTYPNQTFTAVVFRSAAGRFSDLHGWEGKRALVSGRIRLYRGRPEIILEDPKQLRANP